MNDLLVRAARSSLAGPVRRAVARTLGGRPRRVRILGGVGKGGSMELDLSCENAYWTGTYEPDVQDALRRTLIPGAVFWDVGAHIGFFSVCARRLGARVVTFEPAPENAARLRRHGTLNGFEVIEAAAWQDSSGVSLSAGAAPEEWRVAPGGVTPSVALDEVARERGIPDLIKLDVEGAEAAVLAGASEILARQRTVILCELHGDEQAVRVRELLAGWKLTSLEHEWRVLAEPPA